MINEKLFTELYTDITKKATKIPQENYLDEGNYPIVDQGKGQIAGRWNEAEGLCVEIPAIIFGDHTRTIKYIDEPFFIGADGVKVLRPTNQADNPKYYYYALQAARIPNLGYSRHFKVVKELMIRVYTRADQDQIVSILEKIDEVIEIRQAELLAIEQLVKSRFIEMFGSTGKQVPLIDYVWFQEGPGVRSADFTEKGTVLLTGSNINDNEISFGYKSDRHISNELASGKYAHFMCDKDDILVVSSAIDPDKFDKKVVVVGVDKKYCLNTGIIRFKPNKQYLTLGYFREFLKTDYFKHQVSNEMRGIAQMHFGPSHLKQMTILLPDSIDSQIEFDAFMQQVDKSKYYCVLALKIIEKLLAEVKL